MLRMCVISALLLLLDSSCTKSAGQQNVKGEWVWTIQYADNPAYNSSPQSTGIQETLSFSNNGTYSLTQNGVIVNSGTYKTSTAKNTRGETVSSVLYTNTRVEDSVAYYQLTNNNDSLIFSHDLIGTYGSGSRHYRRK
jgi:hypothetical protein